MKLLYLLFAFFLSITLAAAQTNPSIRYQQGYYKPSTDTWVQPHWKTQRNSTNHDNYSTRGNRNSYTGDPGYRARDYSPQDRQYGQGRTIYTGPRGGQYYINANGNKTYIPKRY